MEKLKPCPFCGSEKITYLTRIATWLCIKCGAEGPDGSDKDSAIAAWNTRSETGVKPEDIKHVMDSVRGDFVLSPLIAVRHLAERIVRSAILAFAAWLRERR